MDGGSSETKPKSQPFDRSEVADGSDLMAKRIQVPFDAYAKAAVRSRRNWQGTITEGNGRGPNAPQKSVSRMRSEAHVSASRFAKLRILVEVTEVFGSPLAISRRFGAADGWQGGMVA